MADADRFPWQVNPRGKAANFAPSSQIRQEIGFGQREKQRMLSAALGEDGSIEVQSEYHSARVRAFVDQGGALTSRGAFGDGVGEELDYTVVRSTGLPLGYNLFTTPPVPPLRSEGPAPLLPSSASWYVDVKTLEAGDAAAQLTGLPGKQRAKRQRDAQLVMRHNPTTLLVSEVKALNEAASRLAKLDKSVAESSTNVSTVKDALASDAPKALETAVAVGNKAREAVALHKKSSAEVMQQVTHLDTTWRGLQEEGQKARKGALGRMSEIKDALQSELEEIELRLTDHVLLGTAEEAERMLRHPGPDGDQLRATYHEQQMLSERQRLQRAVLVQVARKAVAASDAHESRMAKAKARLETSMAGAAALEKLTDVLETALAGKTGRKANNLVDAKVAAAVAATTDLRDSEAVATALDRAASSDFFAESEVASSLSMRAATAREATKREAAAVTAFQNADRDAASYEARMVRSSSGGSAGSAGSVGAPSASPGGGRAASQPASSQRVNAAAAAGAAQPPPAQPPAKKKGVLGTLARMVSGKKKPKA